MSLVPPQFAPATGSDPAEDHIGPFYLWRDESCEPPVCEAGMITAPHHTNVLDMVHGGVLMTFADYTFCAVSKTGTSDKAIITVSLTTEFLQSAPAGVWLHGYGAVTRRTGSLVFAQGRLCHGADTLLTYSGVGKRMRAD